MNVKLPKPRRYSSGPSLRMTLHQILAWSACPFKGVDVSVAHTQTPLLNISPLPHAYVAPRPPMCVFVFACTCRPSQASAPNAPLIRSPPSSHSQAAAAAWPSLPFWRTKGPEASVLCHACVLQFRDDTLCQWQRLVACISTTRANARVSKQGTTMHVVQPVTLGVHDV